MEEDYDDCDKICTPLELSSMSPLTEKLLSKLLADSYDACFKKLHSYTWCFNAGEQEGLGKETCQEGSPKTPQEDNSENDGP